MANASLDCIIVEDDPIDRDLLVEYADRHNTARLLWACETAEAAEDRLNSSLETADLVLLDVNLPGQSGLDMIQTIEDPPVVVVVSAESRHAVRAFDVDAADFLVKPVSYERFGTALSRAQQYLQARRSSAPSGGRADEPDAAPSETIFVNTGDRYERLPLSDVLYLESDGNYVRIHMDDGTRLLVRLTLKRAGEVLPAQSFVRVHRSYMVRIDQVENVVDWSVVINGEVIPISESYREAFMEALPTLN